MEAGAATVPAFELADRSTSLAHLGNPEAHSGPEDGKTDPAAYLQRDPDGKPAADFLVFTARTEREDPCAKMRSR